MSFEKSGIEKATAEEIAGTFAAVRAKRPLVHCITNYVTVNDCANALLAVGASPVMADDIAEAAEIASIADALVINIGTLNERTILSMGEACRAAADKGIPLVLDPVGAGASRLRTETARSLVGSYRFSVIRGNASEIRALVGDGATRGVDASETDIAESAFAQTAKLAARLAERTGSLVAVTGAVDIVTDGKRSFAIGNGHPLMARITGSGCMLSAVVGAFVGANPDRLLEATAAAVCLMGLSGERAANAGSTTSAHAVMGLASDSNAAEACFADASDRTIGTGSFRVGLIDGLSLLDGEGIQRGLKIARYP